VNTPSGSQTLQSLTYTILLFYRTIPVPYSDNDHSQYLELDICAVSFEDVALTSLDDVYMDSWNFAKATRRATGTVCPCRIGRKVLNDKRNSAMAVLLMCLSPASVFMTMAYTESLFLLLTSMGVWLLINHDLPLLAAVPFALSCLVRSNGKIITYFPALSSMSFSIML
jgi:hypothetical protein